MADPGQQQHRHDDFHVWVALFAAALSGSWAQGAKAPKDIAEFSGLIADAALKEVQRRRHDPEYQAFFGDSR